MSIMLQKVYEQSYCSKLFRKEVEWLVKNSMSEKVTEASAVISKELYDNFEISMSVSEIEPILTAIHVELLLSKEYRTSMSNLIGITVKYVDTDDYDEAKLLLMHVLKWMVEYEYVGYSLSSTGYFEIGSFVELPEEYAKKVKRVKFLPPMVVQPRLLSSNKDTPYYYTEVDSFMGKNPDKDKDRNICLDFLNQQNAIPLTINLEVYKSVRDKLKDKKYEDDDEEAYEKEFKRKEAFKYLTEVTTETVDEMLEAGNKFWLPHGIDSRGRIYCKAYHINYQSNPFRKSIIDFHEHREVNGIDSPLGDKLKSIMEV